MLISQEDPPVGLTGWVILVKTLPLLPACLSLPIGS